MNNNNSIEQIKQMTENFNIVHFFENSQDSLAVVMITPFQVAIKCCSIFDEQGNLVLHSSIIRELREAMENDDTSVIILKLSNENEYDTDSQEERVVGQLKIFAVELTGIQHGITKDMERVYNMLHDRLFNGKKDSDIICDNLEGLETIGAKIVNKPQIKVTILGMPIEEYIKKIQVKGYNHSTFDGER